MTIPKIRKALERKLIAIDPQFKIAFPNVNSAFLAEQPYIIADTMFTKPETTGYSNAPYIQRGIFQLSLQYPLGKGQGPAQDKAEMLREAFFRGLSLVEDGVTTIIDETPEVTGGAVEGDRFVVRVFIRFYADIQNGV